MVASARPPGRRPRRATRTARGPQHRAAGEGARPQPGMDSRVPARAPLAAPPLAGSPGSVPAAPERAERHGLRAEDAEWRPGKSLQEG
jgi:hypothetical protein